MVFWNGIKKGVFGEEDLAAQYFGFIAIKENGKIIIKKVEPNSW